jgi:hypothetical protein
VIIYIKTSFVDTEGVWCNLYDLCETLNDAAADKITTFNVPQDFDPSSIIKFSKHLGHAPLCRNLSILGISEAILPFFT